MQQHRYSEQAEKRLTDRDRSFLFQQWSAPIATRDADALLVAGDAISLKRAREASLVSVAEMARRLEMSPTAYVHFEKRATEGATTIDNLRRAAHALDCECLIVIRPKDKATFAERIWVPLLNEAVATKWLVNLKAGRLVVALPKRLRELQYDPEFRRAQKWSRLHHDGRRPPAWYL